MIDPVQLVVSVLGVSLIVGLVWLVAGSQLASVGDEAALRQRLAREFPGFSVGVFAIDVQGRAAVVQSSDATEIALLFATGQRITCWLLPAASIRRAVLERGPDGSAVLEVGTGEFSRGRLRLDLGEAQVPTGLLRGLLRRDPT